MTASDATSINWHDFLRTGIGIMKLSRAEFWKLTFVEFWAMYDGMFGTLKEPMTRSRYDEMKAAEAERERRRNGNS